MKNWLKRIKPKIKNWRWWVALPIMWLIGFPLLIAPVYIFEFIGKRLIKISDWWEDLSETKATSLLIKLIDWSKENEQGS